MFFFCITLCPVCCHHLEVIFDFWSHCSGSDLIWYFVVLFRVLQSFGCNAFHGQLNTADSACCGGFFLWHQLCMCKSHVSNELISAVLFGSVFIRSFRFICTVLTMQNCQVCTRNRSSLRWFCGFFVQLKCTFEQSKTPRNVHCCSTYAVSA